MTLFTAFSALLTAFSALLGTPGFSTNADVQQQTMALIPQIQTIGTEVQAQIDAVPTPTPTPITGTGGPTEPVYVPPPQALCTLQVTPDTESPYSGVITWDSSNAGPNGNITVGVYRGCGDNCSDHQMISPVTGGNVSGASGSQTVLFGSSVNLWYPNTSLNHDNNTKIELNMGGATCDYYVPGR